MIAQPMGPALDLHECPTTVRIADSMPHTLSMHSLSQVPLMSKCYVHAARCSLKGPTVRAGLDWAAYLYGRPIAGHSIAGAALHIMWLQQCPCAMRADAQSRHKSPLNTCLLRWPAAEMALQRKQFLCLHQC